MLVQEFLENSARQNPQKIALIADNRRLAYQEIEENANRLANALIQRGVRRGDRIVLYLPNSVDLVIGIFSALKAGAVFVVINPTTKPLKLVYILNDCQAAALVTSPRSSTACPDWPGRPLALLLS